MFDADDELLIDDQIDEQPESAPEQKPAAKEPDPLAEMRDELRSLRTRVSEAENDARFWRTKASGEAPKEEGENDGDDEPSVTDDLLETFSSGDAKRVAKVLKEMGFVRQADVEKAITNTRKEISSQGQLYKTYPDLADSESEFFLETAKRYNQLVQDEPSLKKSPKTIEIAARLTAAELGVSETPSRRDDDGDYERASRVARQSGDRGRGSRAAKGSDGPSELSAVQRSIIAKFQAAGSTVTEEGYRARADKGVKMSGLPRGRGR